MGGNLPYTCCFGECCFQDIYIYIYIYIYIWRWRKVEKNKIIQNFICVVKGGMNIISSNIRHYFNNTFHEFKILKKVFKPKRSTSTSIINSSNFGLFCLSIFLHTVRFNSLIYFIYIYIYINIYIYIYIYIYIWKKRIQDELWKYWS